MKFIPGDIYSYVGEPNFKVNRKNSFKINRDVRILKIPHEKAIFEYDEIVLRYVAILRYWIGGTSHIRLVSVVKCYIEGFL